MKASEQMDGEREGGSKRRTSAALKWVSRKRGRGRRGTAEGEFSIELSGGQTE